MCWQEKAWSSRSLKEDFFFQQVIIDKTTNRKFHKQESAHALVNLPSGPAEERNNEHKREQATIPHLHGWFPDCGPKPIKTYQQFIKHNPLLDSFTSLPLITIARQHHTLPGPHYTTVQFKMVFMYLEKQCSTPPLRSFPSATFETVPVLLHTVKSKMGRLDFPHPTAKKTPVEPPSNRLLT